MAGIDQLRAAIAEAKAADPLAPVTVAVPSNYAALAVRRRLGAEPGGLVNVQFLVLARVAELVGAPVLAAAGRRPLTKAVRTEAIRAALAADAGLFAAVAGHATTIAALDRTFADLRGCSARTLDTLATGSPRAAEVVRLFVATRARLAERYYDEHDLAAAATERANAATLGALIVYLPRPMSPATAAMVAALGGTVIERDPSIVPPVDRVISAIDPDEEMRAAVRVVMEQARAGTPLHRIAILWPADEPYAVLARQQLEAAGVPHNGPAVRTLAHTVTGVALTNLLALPDRRYRRDDVMAWLASAPIIESADGRDITPTRWDVVSGAAGVIEGADQWHARLTNYAAGQAERKTSLAQEEDVEAWRLQRIDDDIDRALRLRAFMAELIGALDRAPTMATWSEHSDWARALLERYLGAESRHYAWPDHEQDAWREITQALEQLSGLDDVGSTVDLVRFRQAVAAELAAPAGRHGRFGSGVFTAHLAAALATDFDAVIVVGLAEGTLPGHRAEDVLLPDHERMAAAGDVGLRGDRIEQELADFRSALNAASRACVLTYPRTDPRRRRELLPSRWLPAGIEPEAVASFQHGVASGEPASLTEYDLRDLLDWTDRGGDPVDHVLAGELPNFGAGLVAATFRAGSEFTRFAGHVGPGYINPLDASAPMSPTSLEAYAVCPARYFFSKVLHINAPERPEEIRRIAPMAKGSLVHEVLDRFITGALDDPELRNAARLDELAEEAFDDYLVRGLTGVPLLWRYERELMRRELTRFFVEDDDGAEPLAAELTFGREGEEPVVLTLPDGREIGFRGSADRVDRMADGALRVTDYKTGGDFKYHGLAEDPVDRGRLLQLPLYGLAARERFGAADTPVQSRYWMVAEKSGFRRHEVTVDDETIARLREVLGVLVEGITAGRFPARPGDEDWRGGWEHCRFCEFDRVCQSDRDRAWERVRDTNELEAYVALVGEAAT